jgi:thymidylate kinase
MLIAIEGIDGAGKTHIAGLLAAALSELGHPAQALNKSDISFGDSFADSRLGLLREAIWPSRGEPKQDLLGTHFYLHLLAAWFSAIGRLLKGSRTISVMDGSQYRVIAKAHRRAGLSLDVLHGYFASAAEPDLVVLLAIDPKLSWTRRAQFKETELGRWDGLSGDPKRAYCAYQDSIQVLLMEMADARAWMVVLQDETTRDTAVVDAILQHLGIDAEQPSSRLTTAPQQPLPADQPALTPAAI